MLDRNFIPTTMPAAAASNACRRHRFPHLFAISLACALFCITMLFTSGAFGHRLGLFVNTPGGFAEKFYLNKYKLEVTPADWVFYLSAIIYIWQALWLIYGISTVFRRSGQSYVYLEFPVLPPILYVVFAFSLACNINWLLIWERQYMEVALVFVNLMSLTLYICLIVSLRRLQRFFDDTANLTAPPFQHTARLPRYVDAIIGEPAFPENNSTAGEAQAATDFTRDVWLVRIVVHNGLAMFAVWSTVASMFNFAVVLTYRTGARQTVSSTVALSIFAIEIVVWWTFENFVYERHMRYLVTPYVVLATSIVGIIWKNGHELRTSNEILVVSLLVLVVALAIGKLLLSIWRRRRARRKSRRGRGDAADIVVFNRNPWGAAVETDGEDYVEMGEVERKFYTSPTSRLSDDFERETC